MTGDAELLRLAFNRSPLDRIGERRRDAAFLEAALADRDALVLVVSDAAKVPVSGNGSLEWQPLSKEAPEDLVLLGADPKGRPLFSRELAADEELGAFEEFVALREVALTLDAHEAAAAFHAVAMTVWHRRTKYCANCGSATRPEDAGHVRRCVDCGTSHFPRTDPAVIMLVRDGDRCVLGRRTGAPEHRWSTLAGFVEPGESLESAVAREVLEEVGLVVNEVRYQGSQPWPFPASLMVAFEAEATYGPLVLNDEHHAVAWFEREELREGIASGHIAIPGPISAGHFLIQRWLSEGGD